MLGKLGALRGVDLQSAWSLAGTKKQNKPVQPNKPEGC
jgi:hypothetical protein